MADTDTLQQGKAIFLDIARLLNDGKGQEALDLLQQNKELLFKADPEKTLRADFELRFLLKQFDEAYADYEYFSALPYVSQEIEEILRDLPKMIRANELACNSAKSFDEEEAHAALNDGDDPYAILGVLQGLKGRDITPFLDELCDLLDSEIHDDVKTFALLLLTERKIDREVVLNKLGRRYKLNPIKLGNPFMATEYLEIREMLSKEKDTSLTSVAASLLDQLALAYYPERICIEADLQEYYLALVSLSGSYLGKEIPGSLSEHCLMLLQEMKKRLSSPSLLA